MPPSPELSSRIQEGWGAVVTAAVAARGIGRRTADRHFAGLVPSIDGNVVTVTVASDNEATIVRPGLDALRAGIEAVFSLQVEVQLTVVDSGREDRNPAAGEPAITDAGVQERLTAIEGNPSPLQGKGAEREQERSTASFPGIGVGRPAEPTIIYYSSHLILATLAHTDPNPGNDPDRMEFTKCNGRYRLICVGGELGLPYGALVRLFLGYIMDSVVRGRVDPVTLRLALEESLPKFMIKLGYAKSGTWRVGSKADEVHKQLRRLLTSTVRFEYVTELKTSTSGTLRIAQGWRLWDEAESGEDDEEFTGAWVRLSPEFYKDCQAHQVPISADILFALKRSPMAMDVYMWISWRINAMRHREESQVRVGQDDLKAQFGTNIVDDAKFWQTFRNAVKRLVKLWAARGLVLHAECPLRETYLNLSDSPLIIEPSDGPERDTSEIYARLMGGRSFDKETLERAQLVAGGWKQQGDGGLVVKYVQWIRKKQLSPTAADERKRIKNIRNHYLSFVKHHRHDNGDFISPTKYARTG
jgi:Plasmid encoded RepA protein